jgi:hypothetical protein
VSANNTAATSRRADCPRCLAKRPEYCVNPDGSICYRSHDERTAAALAVPDVSAAQLEMLRKLSVDPTRHMSAAMRLALLRRGLVTSPPGRREHPLTDKGREAIDEVPTENGLPVNVAMRTLEGR